MLPLITHSVNNTYLFTCVLNGKLVKVIFITPFCQVPLGIIPKNEAKTEGMVAILTHSSQYVPDALASSEITLSTGGKVVVENHKMHRILFGGDQMTAARARAGIDAKLNGDTKAQRLDGIIPVFEDWHSRTTFMDVSACLLFKFRTTHYMP